MNDPEHFPPSLPVDPTTFAWRLLHRPINHVEGYQHGANAKAYLRRCAEQAGLQIKGLQRNDAGVAAMRAAGYASWDKFVRHAAEWHALSRPFPRSYADFLGVTTEELLAAVEADRQDHERALAAPPVLYSWTLRRMAGVYEVRPFPADCHGELLCLQYVRAACVHHCLRASIHVPGVRTLWTEPPDGHVKVTVYPPGVKLTRTHFVFADDGGREGTMQTS